MTNDENRPFYSIIWQGTQYWIKENPKELYPGQEIDLWKKEGTKLTTFKFQKTITWN
jgi:hypothetical protein